MKPRMLLIIAAIVLVAGCNTSKPFQQIQTENPEYIPNTIFTYYKDSSYPMFKALREKYQLDTIFHGEQDEFKRILLLRHWIFKTVPITPNGVVLKSQDNSAESILDDALKGNMFHCAYFMIVNAEIMNACGYMARVINADEGENNLPGQIAHHGTDEVWSNTFHKWFFSDAMFDLHFEKNGIPLSALEIRDEYFKNKAADVLMVSGPDRTPIDTTLDKYKRSKEIFARVFRWIAWFKQQDIYSNWDNGISYMVMYEDDYFKTHQWIRVDGKPHWAYGTKYLILVKDRKQLYWTPNTITSEVKINGNNATVKLNSYTPFFKTYEMKEGEDGKWKDVPDSLDISLQKNKNEFLFRTVNMQGATGAEYKIVIER
ncbi:MAG: transglutaminase domain-containing protein [Chitinophagaceae bacterium]|nr:transglutaminase domain-containing protein [Chitinophagaceae bacterium]